MRALTRRVGLLSGQGWLLGVLVGGLVQEALVPVVLVHRQEVLGSQGYQGRNLLGVKSTNHMNKFGSGWIHLQ
jgi:hypothetical protein